MDTKGRGVDQEGRLEFEPFEPVTRVDVPRTPSRDSTNGVGDQYKTTKDDTIPTCGEDKCSDSSLPRDIRERKSHDRFGV